MGVINQWSDDNYDYIVYSNGSTVKSIKSNVPMVALDEIKTQKIQSLQQSYYASFTTFQSDALGTVKTYPIDKEAQDNLRDYQNRLIADPNKDSFYFKTIEDATLVLHNRQQFLQLMEDAEMFKVNQTIKINDLVKRVETAYNNGDSSGIEIITW
jgi:hypothetical protein